MEINQVWPDWQVEEAIGQGSYGTVYKCVNGEGKYSAIKVISVPQNELELKSGVTAGMTDEQQRSYYKEIIDDFVNEINLLEELKGAPNIVGIEDSLVVEKPVGIGWQIFIRMELLNDFQSYLSTHTMSEEDVIRLGIDVCNALTVCGSKNIIHRDIKPENIFVDSEGNFKLGDFGVAKQLEKTEASMSRRGTYNYMAPEVLSAKRYDSRADIYSLGIVMYKLLNKNRLPFIDPEKQIVKYSERQQAFEKRINGEKIPPVSGISSELNKVVLQACAFKPEDRFKKVIDLKQSLEKLLSGNKNDSKIFDIISVLKSNRFKAVISIILVLAILSGGAVLLKKALKGKGQLSESVSETDKSTSDVKALFDGKYVGGVIRFGSYPQTEVTDKKILEKLDKSEKSWISYDYYSSDMQYADFEYDSEKYRAVKFSSYRPVMNGSELSTEYPQQKINGYTDGKVYYFRYEPIDWLILDVDSGLLVSEKILDVQPFQNSTEKNNGAEYVENNSASDYVDSSMQSWLTDVFYHCAFNENQRKLIHKNKHISEALKSGSIEKVSTKEKVSVLTKNEALNEAYMFKTKGSADKSRIAIATDYAKCQGCLCGNNGEGTWWLRSPKNESEVFAVSIDGSFCEKNVRYANVGVRPVIELYDNASRSENKSEASSKVKTTSESKTEESTSESTTEETVKTENENPEQITEIMEALSEAEPLVSSEADNAVAIVLNWKNGADLDAHLSVDAGDRSDTVTYNSKYCYDSDGKLLASFDADNTDGSGSEMITIHEPFAGEYTFSVYNFSGNTALGLTEAVVEVYSRGRRIATFNAPESFSEREWYVFRIANGEIEEINTNE